MFNPELGQLAIGKTERKERGRCCFAAEGRKRPVYLHDLQVQRIPQFTTLVIMHVVQGEAMTARRG